jgi:membrane fusion protein, macrolide-specific efflux system
MRLRVPPSLRSGVTSLRARVGPARSGLVLNAVLGTVALVGALFAYHLVTATAQTTTTPTGGARTVPVTQGEVTATVSATGAVQSASTAAADFTTAGTVTSIAVHVGDTVTQGQELARVDPAASQATVDTARANLTAARASLTRAQSGGDDATIAAAQAQVTSASAAVDAAVRALNGTVLSAPIAGTVTAINGSVGATASTSGTGSSGSGSSGSGSSGGANSSSSTSTGFIQLADLSQMQASASFAEADATRLKNGQAATVTWAALTNATATGAVATIAPTATTTNNVNSYGVVVSLTQLPAGVRIGQTVTVSVVVGQVADALRVPTAAVRTVSNRRVVTVVGADGTEALREVTVGVEGNTFVEIQSGLTAGEQVAIVVSSSTTTNGTNGFPGGGGGGLGGGLGGGGLGGAGTGGNGRTGTGTTR